MLLEVTFFSSFLLLTLHEISLYFTLITQNILKLIQNVWLFTITQKSMYSLFFYNCILTEVGDLSYGKFLPSNVATWILIVV